VKEVLEQLAATIRRAGEERRPLCIQSGGSKRFYGREPVGQPLSLNNYHGIVSYEPSELVVTARAGCLLSDVHAALAEEGQMLAFEPPAFGAAATVGGMVASGLSGPRRAYAGSVRDFVLGVTAMSANGEVMRYGGQVMKNVAGFDVSRLMVGALGTLGVILEVSFKVLPVASGEITLVREADLAESVSLMNAWAAKPYPVSATAWLEGQLWVRISGASAALSAARTALGGEEDVQGRRFWTALREQQLAFFDTDAPIWRLSLPPATDAPEVMGQMIVEWGGAQRWVKGESSIDFKQLAGLARERGGHAMVFRGGQRTGEVFSPLAPAVHALHQRIKSTFDPHGIFNPGRLYADW